MPSAMPIQRADLAAVGATGVAARLSHVAIDVHADRGVIQKCLVEFRLYNADGRRWVSMCRDNVVGGGCTRVAVRIWDTELSEGSDERRPPPHPSV